MPPRPRTLAHHLVLSGYGFWLANDPRGSGSAELRDAKFQNLGPIHHGRNSIQPSREELRRFHQQACPKLEFAPLWFDDAMRTKIGDSFGQAIARQGYTVWPCSVGSNHAHVCVRVHRDSYQTMWSNLTSQARTNLLAQALAPPGHRVWAQRPYSVYLHSPGDIRRVIAYIENNPGKECLPRQYWAFVKPYHDWPAP